MLIDGLDAYQLGQVLCASGLSDSAYRLAGSESSQTQEGAAGRMPGTKASGQKSMFGIDQAASAGVRTHF